VKPAYPLSATTLSLCEISFFAPIEYDAFNRGYYYTQKYYHLPAGFTSSEDLIALGMAKSILSLYKDTPLYEASYQLLESIITPITSDGNKDWMENRIVVPPPPQQKLSLIFGKL
jgi:hypothetical protein